MILFCLSKRRKHVAIQSMGMHGLYLYGQKWQCHNLRGGQKFDVNKHEFITKDQMN